MGLFDNGLKIGNPIVLGIGALVLTPVLLPLATSVLRPMAKATIKSGFILVNRGRELVAETVEMIADITAEVREEMALNHENPVAGSGPEEIP